MLVQSVEEGLISELSKKIINKKFFLQFYPSVFGDLYENKTILYGGKKLKTAYIIDIIHNLVLKYHFKGENKFNLNSKILKEKYGYFYNYYINYLIENNILIMIQNYKCGQNSRVYSLGRSVLESRLNRYENKDTVLLKKYKRRVIQSDDITELNSNLIDNDIKYKLIGDLYDVSIDFERSLFYLDTTCISDLDVYNRNVYSLDCIKNKSIFYHFDRYGRMHTNFTILKSFVRKNCLLIGDMTTSEIDISNSQPLFLTKLINNMDSKWVREEEFNLFKLHTKGGTFYQYMMSQLNMSSRKDVKNMVYVVLFGRNSNRSKADIKFKSVFPSIHRFIVLYKKQYSDYKILSHHLQKMESGFIYNKIIRKIMNNYPYIKLITVHDSIIYPSKYRNEVETIFRNEMIDEFNF
jgi:hypothetical protein